MALHYDPDCGFCTLAAQRLSAWGAEVVPLADESCQIDHERAQREVPFVSRHGSVTYGAEAIAQALLTCRRPWSWAGRVLSWSAVQLIARPVYSAVARNRHRLPGGTAACDLSSRPRSPQP